MISRKLFIYGIMLIVLLNLQQSECKQKQRKSGGFSAFGFVELILELFLPIFTSSISPTMEPIPVATVSDMDARNVQVNFQDQEIYEPSPRKEKTFEPTSFRELDKSISKMDPYASINSLFTSIIKYYRNEKELPDNVFYYKPRKDNEYFALFPRLLSSSLLIRQISNCDYDFDEIKEFEKMIKNGEKDESDLGIACLQSLWDKWSCYPSLPITDDCGSRKKTTESPQIQEDLQKPRAPLIPILPPLNAKENLFLDRKQNSMATTEENKKDDNWEKERLKDIFNSDILDTDMSRLPFNF